MPWFVSRADAREAAAPFDAFDGRSTLPPVRTQGHLQEAGSGIPRVEKQRHTPRLTNRSRQLVAHNMAGGTVSLPNPGTRIDLPTIWIAIS